MTSDLMTSDLLTTMRQRLIDAEQDADRLRRAITLLEASEPSASTPPRRARRARPAPELAAEPTPAPVPVPVPTKVVSLETLLQAVEAEPGQTTTALARRLDADQSAVLELLKAQETEGVVRREGERRSTTWWYVDEYAAYSEDNEEDFVGALQYLGARDSGYADSPKRRHAGRNGRWLASIGVPSRW